MPPFTFICPPCPVCKKRSTFQVEIEKLKAWKAGGYIQNIWPEFSDTQRETMMTGFCGECWDKVFKGLE